MAPVPRPHALPSAPSWRRWLLALLAVALLVGSGLSTVGQARSHGVAPLQHAALVADDGADHGHSHDDEDWAGDAAPWGHTHHAADHSHDKAHAVPGVTAQVPVAPRVWRPVFPAGHERLPADRLDRPPRA